MSAVFYNTTWRPAYIHHTTHNSASSEEQWTSLPGLETIPAPSYFKAHPSSEWVYALVAATPELPVVKFALTNGSEAWDNNKGSNYTIGPLAEETFHSNRWMYI